MPSTHLFVVCLLVLKGQLAAAEGTVADTTRDYGMNQLEVFGGDIVPPGRYPFNVGLRRQKDGTNKCGGALIAPQYVLTAAHCAYTHLTWASVGSHFSNGSNDGEQIELQTPAFVHPLYSNTTLSYDIAVFKLKHAVSDLVTFQPVTLSSALLYTCPGMWTTVRGWGANELGKYSDELREVPVQVTSNGDCSRLIKEADPETIMDIDSSMLCAGGIVGEDSCYGDSGGPLTVTKDSKEILVGVVSWGVVCGGVNTPSVYARVSQSRSFIDSVSVGHRYDRHEAVASNDCNP